VPPRLGVQPALRAFASDDEGSHAGLMPRQQAAWPINLDEKKHAQPVLMEATCLGMAGERWEDILIEADIHPRLIDTVR